MFGSAAGRHPTNTTDLSSPRYLNHCTFAPPRSYTAHTPSPLVRSSDTCPPSGSSWKDHHPLPYDSVELEEPLSPLNPTFSGGESPPAGMSGTMFGSLHDEYGPSPPGTGTSTSSNAPTAHNHPYPSGGPNSPSNSKQYSFVSLPGNAMKKRPRRRYDEIERLYQCSWPNCTKAYGTLNHLNAHITMQKHGPKRSPNEFKELRKQWRKAKKEEAEARALDEARHGFHHHHHPSQHPSSRHSISGAEYQSHGIRSSFDYILHPERPVQPIGPLDGFHDSVAHARDCYPRKSQRFDPLVSPSLDHSGTSYPHPPIHGPSTSSIPGCRLPASSTLLTPLPGYESSTVSSTPNFDPYGSYDPHRIGSRARTGHGSSSSHGDRGRLRSGHVAGHGSDRS